MALVSYAQNFEDIMLWRALGHIPQGTYLDIGAQDPSFDSVSRCFYDHGWRGVHVEPTPAYASLLREERPDEIVIEAVVAEQSGTVTFFEIPSTGLSTGRKDIASGHAENGFPAIERVLPSVTLSALFDTFGGKEIHWMKIDVEGMEREVLEGWADHPARPWVLSIESTFPGSQRPTHGDWLDIVLKRGYREVWFDGLSRFFVAEGHDELLPHFELPPNIFDGFAISIDHLMASYLKQDAAALAQDHLVALDALRTEANQARAREEANAVEAQKETRALTLSFQAALADLSLREKEARKESEEMSQRYQALQDEARHLLTAELRAQRDAFEERLASELQSLRGEAGRMLEAQQAGFQRLLSRELEAQQEKLQRLYSAEQETLRRDFQQQLKVAHSQQRAQREDFQHMLAEAKKREATLQSALSLIEARYGEANDRLGGALEEARNAHVEVSRLRTVCEAERARSAHLQARLDSIRKHLSQFMGRIAVPFAQMQAALFGSKVSFEAADLLFSSPHDLDPPREEVASVADLLKTHDGVFVRLAYLCILGREPDGAGFDHYLNRLRAGYPKDGIIADLAASKEAQQYGPALNDLDRLTRRSPLQMLTGKPKPTPEKLAAASFENVLGRELAELAALTD